MKIALAVLLGSVMITSGAYAQDKKVDPKPAEKAVEAPKITDTDKASLAVDERDLAQLQAQISQLQANYQQTLNHAQTLVKDAEKKAGEGWALNTQTFQFTKVTPPVKETPSDKK